ncbi:hypothetical protein [Emticicia sp. BO119]|uniref:hypothetical protein n=1 Tax=Emticicia sp. BO119 TaxID=2757768 RepID=UPI0015F04831|nr:hypothetical protein [Emticicia sp. BO119]MBA4849038.1 hypothetical protein [Emticicia sp. BO119]
MAVLTTILATIGSLAKPIADIIVSKDNLKLQKVSLEQLQEQVEIAKQENDKQKIVLAQKALELKQEEAQQETNQKVLQGVVVIASLGLLGTIMYFLFGKVNNPKISSSPTKTP